MRNLVKYVGIGLLVMGLAACDDKDTNATAQGSVAESNATGNPVNLLDGKLSFSLPADMTDQSGKLGTQANNMHVWSDATGQKAVIVIMGDDPKEDLAVLAKRLEDQQRSRDPQLQVVTNKAIELKGHKMQQLDSIISAKGQTAYSSVILGNVGNQLLTMQITLPADDQQKAQTTAENAGYSVSFKMMRRPQGRVPEAVFLIATSVITRLRPVPPPPDKSPVRPPSSSPAQPVVQSRQAINP